MSLMLTRNKGEGSKAALLRTRVTLRYNRSVRALSTIEASVFAAGGAGIVGWFVWALPASWRSKKWPSVAGVVVNARLETLSNRQLREYRPEISYTYTLNSTEFTSSRVTFGDFLYSSFARGASQRRVAKYPVGSTVCVFYDPGDPREAVLEPGITWSLFVVAGIGIVSLTVAAAIVVGAA